MTSPVCASKREAVQQAAMQVDFLLPDGSVTELQGLTDARGQWKVEPPPVFDRILRVTAAKPGYVSLALTAKDDGRIDPILIRQCFLSRPEPIGGTIIDPTGAPVEGAVVTANSREERGDSVSTYGAGKAVTTTDAKGNWRLEELNSACIYELTVAKPGYASRTHRCKGNPLFSNPQNALTLGSDIPLLLAKPTDIQGSVVDWRGEAVEGASVFFRRDWDGFRTNTVSGSNGRFSLSSIPPDYSARQHAPYNQELSLLVRATNFAPVLRRLPHELSSIAGLRIVLNPGQRIEGRIVDQDEQAVPDAQVRTDFGSTMTTDDQGRFVVEHAWDTLQVSVREEGYDDVIAAVIIPHMQTNAITLRRLGLIQGTVSDSVTGAPVPSFRIKMLPADINTIFNEPSPVITTNFTAGTFTLATSATYSGPAWRLLIQAPDYKTVVTEILDGRSGDVALDMECTLESFPDDGKLVLQVPGSIVGRIGDAPAVQPAYNVQIARITDGNKQARSNPRGTRLGEDIPIRIQPDGNFLTANLIPGTYELSVIVGDSDPHIIDELKTRTRDTLRSMPFDPLAPRRRFPAPNRSMLFEKPSAVAKSQLERDDWMMGAVPIGYLRSTVDVPAGPPDKQVDLGTFELFSHPRLKLNDAAPAFDIPTLDGGRIRLSDYRGKWLTLYFWHSGSRGSTCEMELRYLKMLWSEFQDNPRLALAGVVLDENSEDARASGEGGPNLHLRD
jgi:hypothetical protein